MIFYFFWCFTLRCLSDLFLILLIVPIFLLRFIVIFLLFVLSILFRRSGFFPTTFFCFRTFICLVGFRRRFFLLATINFLIKLLNHICCNGCHVISNIHIYLL